MTSTLVRYSKVLEIVGDIAKVEIPETQSGKGAVARLGDLSIVENVNGEQSLARIINIDRNKVSLQIFTGTKGLSTGASVRFLGHPMLATYSDNILGRVFGGAGEPTDGGPDLEQDPKVVIGGPSVNPMRRVLASKMIRTDVPMIDVFNCLVESQKIPIFSVSGEPFNPFLARIGIQADADVVVFGGLGLIFDDYHFFRTAFEDAGVFARTVMFVNQASGVYVERPDGSLRFRWVKAPTSAELTALAHTIARRVGRYLERRGLIERDAETTYLTLDGADEDPMHQLLGDSITYRISVGPQRGRKVFTLQTLPPGEPEERLSGILGQVAGFSLHGGVSVKGDQRGKLERLCRYIARPAISERRLSLTPGGKVRYQLKTPYRDGTTHVIFEPLDFVAKLAALVPKPRVNLTRYHGLFAPNSRYRARVTPAKRGKGHSPPTLDELPERPPCKRRAPMTWAQRLKRVFDIDIEICRACGGALRVIACIEDPGVIEKILKHLNEKSACLDTHRLPETRAPPQQGSLDL